MDVQTIKAFGTEFRCSKARDFEVIIDANGYINYSKLLESISCKSSKFKKLCEHNSSIFTLIYDYENAKIDAYLLKSKKSQVAAKGATSENSENLSLPKTLTISQLVEANIFIVYSGSNSKENRACSGTYGPRYLLDILIMTTDVRYYRRIHDTLEAIDAYAIKNNKSFAGELERIQEQYEEKLERAKILLKEKEEDVKRYKSKNKTLEQKIEQLIEDGKRKDEKIDELISQGYQQLGMLEEAAEERRALLIHDEAQARDNKLIKSKLDVLCNKVSSLNASNYDEDASVNFVWTLFRSESMNIGYTKPIPEKAIWIYSSLREDKNRTIPSDAEILLEVNVVSRSIYETLVRELESMTMDIYYRHILISYENAIAFIDKLNELLDVRSIHPETYNIEALEGDIETMKAEAELERKREEKRAHQVAVRQAIIDNNKLYIYIYSRWRRLYNKNEDGLTTELTASKFFYIRRGANGSTIERVQSRTLESSSFRANGDPRIRYE